VTAVTHTASVNEVGSLLIGRCNVCVSPSPEDGADMILLFMHSQTGEPSLSE
jgi:hypothetical protein